jgi:hypothetical protein
MTNKYELPNATLTAAIKQLPRDKWQQFCSELFDYMNHHADACEGMQALADLGLIEFKEPETFTWVDDDKGEVTIVVKDGATGETAQHVFGGKDEN